MEIRLLEYFLAVCEELHFTRAADKLGITQPTLSHQIRLLEHQVGTPLFLRVAKKVHLTEAGTLLQSHAQAVFRELAQARTAINELRDMRRGRLRIGCSGNHLLGRTIAAFRGRYPDVALSVLELATEETLQRLWANQLDLGITFLPVGDPGLTAVPLFDEELQIAISAAHPLAELSTPSITIREAACHPLAQLPPKFHVRQMMDQALNKAGVPLKPALELSTLEALLQAARHGLAAAVLPRSYLRTADTSDLRVLSLTDPVPRQPIGLVVLQETYRCVSIRAFESELRGNFAEMDF